MTALPMVNQVKSIACLMLGAIGDFIVTTPTLEALRAAYPNASITLVMRAGLTELAEGGPWIDDIIVLRDGFLGKVGLVAALRLRRWDMWVDLHVPTFNTYRSNEQVFRRNALLRRAARARYRLAFSHPPSIQDLTHAIPAPSLEVMALENIAVTTRRLLPGGERAALRKTLPSPKATVKADADRKLTAAGAEGAPLIAIFFGSKQPSGVWPYARVLELCRRLPNMFPGYRFPILGGPHERSAVDRLRGEIGGLFPPLLDLTDRLSLSESATVMANCRAVVATDSGPMHMADAVGVPLVALFGAKNPLPLWLPLSDKARVLTHAVPCAGCLQSVCDRDNLCMDLITPDETLAALSDLLREPE